MGTLHAPRRITRLSKSPGARKTGIKNQVSTIHRDFHCREGKVECRENKSVSPVVYKLLETGSATSRSVGILSSSDFPFPLVWGLATLRIFQV
jgi:hypothetical protein